MTKKSIEENKDYIIQCREAKEIGDLWRPALGDIYYKYAQDEYDVDKIVMVIDEKMNYFGLPRAKNFWLPHQGQLQEMIMGNYGIEKIKCPASDLIKMAIEFKREENKGYYFKFNSMEQLWLAFVMKEKYSKIWNGKNWVKIRKLNLFNQDKRKSVNII